MPLRERIAAIQKEVPGILSNKNVQMLTNPSSTGKKLLAAVTKSYTQLNVDVKFLDATIKSVEKELKGIAASPLEDTETLFKNAENLMRQATKAKAIVAKNVDAIEKALPGLKKAYGLK